MGGWYVLPTYHPAALIYDKTKLPAIRSDLELALPFILNAMGKAQSQ
jgi:uracil-DNA glycosylase